MKRYGASYKLAPALKKQEKFDYCKSSQFLIIYLYLKLVMDGCMHRFRQVFIFGITFFSLHYQHVLYQIAVLFIPFTHCSKKSHLQLFKKLYRLEKWIRNCSMN